MRPTRLRLRTLMIAVAGIALILAGATWAERHRRWVRNAIHISIDHQRAARIAADIRVIDGRKVSPGPAEVARARRRVEYHDAMAHKYSQAAVRPWWPIWPDLPEPE